MMQMLRTPEGRFNDLEDFPYKAHYCELGHGRMHYLDEGDGQPVLCLHGEPSWCYLYRKFIPVLSPEFRLIAPDLFGFGKSDKPSRIVDYSYEFHFESLFELIDRLHLKNITLVVQDWGGLLGLGLLGARPDLFSRVVIMNTFLPIGSRPMPFAFKIWKLFSKYWPVLPIGYILKKGTYRHLSPGARKAYEAPFPSEQYKAGARAFPLLVPSKPTDKGVEQMKKARETLAEWHKPALVLFSDKDPIMRGGDRFFNGIIPSRKDKQTEVIRDAGHFLQEDAGEQIAKRIAEFIGESY